MSSIRLNTPYKPCSDDTTCSVEGRELSTLESPPAPRAEYTRRLEAWKAAHTRYDLQHRRLGATNLAMGVLALAVAGVALLTKAISVFWVAAPLAAIIVIAIRHERLLKEREHCSRTMRFYERALARIDNLWMGSGESGERFLDASHPYSRDLDLFGTGSLFQLLCAARTHAGQETLAQWLLAPATPDEIRARQEAVSELRSRLDLRENLAVLAEEALSLVPAEALAKWGESERLLPWRRLRILSPLLMGLWATSLAAWMTWGAGYIALLLTAANVGVYLAYRLRVAKTAGAADSATAGLALLAGVMARLESEKFATARLVALQKALQSHGQRLVLARGGSQVAPTARDSAVATCQCLPGREPGRRLPRSPWKVWSLRAKMARSQLGLPRGR